jgi:hypothetical protein
MFRLLAVTIMLLILSPDWADSQSSPAKAQTNPQLKKLALYSRLYPVYVLGTISTPSIAKRYLRGNSEETARTFLDNYYGKKYPGLCKLMSKSPTTFLLSPIQGYVTPELWENVLITIDNFHLEKDMLSFKVSMRGEYLKVATIAVTRESFDNAYFLEKDYIPELNQRCNEVLAAFKQFLIN